MPKKPVRAGIHLLFDDDTEAVVPMKPATLAAVEKHLGENVTVNRGGLLACWYALKRPMGNFDAWSKRVDAWNEVELDRDGNIIEETDKGEEGDDSPEVQAPATTAVSGAGSPASVSEPDATS